MAGPAGLEPAWGPRSLGPVVDPRVKSPMLYVARVVRRARLAKLGALFMPVQRLQ